MLTTEDIIREAVRKFGPGAFKAPTKTKFSAGRFWRGHVPVESEQILHLPNGATVQVKTAPDGIVTHVQEDDAQHAIVRPNTTQARFFRP